MKMNEQNWWFSVLLYLPCETEESTLNKDKKVRRRVSLEAAIIEDELELYFLTLSFWFSYRSLHYLPRFLLFPFWILLFVVLFRGEAGVCCRGSGLTDPERTTV